MRARIYTVIFNPYFFLATLIISSSLTYFTGGLGYLYGMLAALIGFWASKFSGSKFGISRPNWFKTIILALCFAIGIFLIVDGFIQPLLERFIDPVDLSALDALRGNFLNYFIFILFMWVVAGFGEEFLYRGFFMKHLAELLGNKKISWFLSGLLISILFGIAHLYQGLSGVITTGLIGFIFALIFIANKSNLILLMLIHGFYDMIGLTFIYLDIDKSFTKWMQSILF